MLPCEFRVSGAFSATRTSLSLAPSLACTPSDHKFTYTVQGEWRVLGRGAARAVYLSLEISLL